MNDAAGISPSVFRKLQNNRPDCLNINGAICDREGTRSFLDVLDANGQWTGLSGFKVRCMSCCGNNNTPVRACRIELHLGPSLVNV